MYPPTTLYRCSRGCGYLQAERQAERMRARLPTATGGGPAGRGVLDLRAGSTSEVTSVSNDSLVVQDALAEKLRRRVRSAVDLWRFTLVTLPSALLHIVPGVAYGRALTDLARRIRDQYARPARRRRRAGRLLGAHRVLVRGREGHHGAALRRARGVGPRLGLRQGLAKGVAVGSNAATALPSPSYAFNIWYDSRGLVMYHGYPGRHRLRRLLPHRHRRRVPDGALK
ncbi:hypothetical protein PVAP13_1NG287219 [Panicum virgatum]|uniref:Uncharacterized protein n=1 Tax=Panicum virgatum TaxID=38727 RepID=A0A8T0X0X5_PANVG|nr:hypothetical protein PVAP13_1NG287219 [Panicum virgatum]